MNYFYSNGSILGMSKIIAIDTSTDACSVAMLIDRKVIERFKVLPKQHTSIILPMIDEVLSEADLKLNDLDAIAFGAGPGSFTGIRLAASIAQGLSFGFELPIIRVSTLQAIAQEVFDEFGSRLVLVVQDARVQEVCCGKYMVDAGGIMKPIEADKIISPDKVLDYISDEVVGAGNGFDIYGNIFAKSGKIKVVDKKYAKASYVAKLAAFDFVHGSYGLADDALPIYLRDQVAKKSVF